MDPINGNGTLTRTKKKRPHSLLPSPSVYRECLKNHAASLGGHALDGCGEFMPSPSSNPSDPSSLTCAACSCHRNFHRRLPVVLPLQEDDDEDDVVEDREEDDDRDGEEDLDRDVSSSDRAHSTSPPPQSATHMLLALSTGHPASGPTQQQLHRSDWKTTTKRFRSKFSQEQKEKMQELSERLGWRMQRRDEGVVEAACREIGVGRGVFKVWMHNNKHIFTKKSNTPSGPVSSANHGNGGLYSKEGGSRKGGGGIENLEMRFNGAATST